MSVIDVDLTGAEVLWPDGLSRDTLSLSGGRIADAPVGRTVDLSGFLVLPGIVDLHGDAFERHVAPRRGVMSDPAEGIVATEAEIAANGVTTAVIAQFFSWEGGLRGADFADTVLRAMARVKGGLVTDLIAQLRFEIGLLDDYATLPQKVLDWDVGYVVFNDHLPHDRLAEGRTPPRLTGQALKAGRNPEAQLAMMQAMHDRWAEVPDALDWLTAELAGQGIRLGSHDDSSPDARRDWRARGVRLSEFPETLETAEDARDHGDPVIMGAPNLVRGGSHKGNVGARDLVAAGLCTALASDYHYPSLRRAAFLVADESLATFAEAWALVSSGPAGVLGLGDRGRFEPGLRADLTILDAQTRRVAATMAAGRFSFLSGEAAARFVR